MEEWSIFKQTFFNTQNANAYSRELWKECELIKPSGLFHNFCIFALANLQLLMTFLLLINNILSLIKVYIKYEPKYKRGYE